EIRPVKDSFWDKVSANIDLGYNITKANNLRQFNTRAHVAYTTKRWEVKGTYNTVFSNQDSVAATKRTDANLTFVLFLPKDWFIAVANDFLSNDEILLDLRSTSKLGVGNYLVHTNLLYFSVFGGAAFNNEVFTDETPTRQSGEAFAGFEVNMFNTGDLSLLTNLTAYPSLTEDGRVRADFKFDLKYDLPKDFYIKAGTTVNFDNRPVGDADKSDYVIQTGFGWEW
ncbi:MAG: DUF481 domain-containing protein, partial [Bacteroidota bacterium]